MCWHNLLSPPEGKYHQLRMLSLLSSEWDEVGHMRIKHQHIKVRLFLYVNFAQFFCIKIERNFRKRNLPFYKGISECAPPSDTRMHKSARAESEVRAQKGATPSLTKRKIEQVSIGMVGRSLVLLSLNPCGSYTESLSTW